MRHGPPFMDLEIFMCLMLVICAYLQPDHTAP